MSFSEFDNFEHFLESWDDFGSIEVRNTVKVRNDLGQFARHIEDIDAEATEAALREGERVARYNAPVKTGTLRNSIHYVVESPKRGYFAVAVPYWKIAERGARPHAITGNVRFFWVREGRMWTPGRNTISHPGYAGFHYMEAGRQAAQDELVRYMRERYASL